MTPQRTAIESLQFENIDLHFGDRKSVLRSASCSFPHGQVVWLKSKPGAGKSSVIKLLNGLLRPVHGNYLLNGQAVNEMSFEEFLPYRLNIGYSFDFGGLINNRSIYSNLALPLEYHSWFDPGGIHERITYYLERFNLQDVANERPSAVVGGQRKATCVARALVMEPDLLLLDDPTTGLRGELVHELSSLIVEKRKAGIFNTTVIATENQEFILPICDSIMELVDGTLHSRKAERKVA